MLLLFTVACCWPVVLVPHHRYAGELHVTIIATGFSQSYEEGLFRDNSRKGRSGRRTAAGAAAPQTPATVFTKTREMDQVEAAAPAGAGKAADRQFIGRGLF